MKCVWFGDGCMKVCKLMIGKSELELSEELMFSMSFVCREIVSDVCEGYRCENLIELNI